MNPRGFTLLELLVVISILAVMAGATLISYRRVQSALELDAAIAALEKDILNLKDAARFGVHSDRCLGLKFTVGSFAMPIEFVREGKVCATDAKAIPADSPQAVAIVSMDPKVHDFFLYAEPPEGNFRTVPVGPYETLTLTVAHTRVDVTRVVRVDLTTGILKKL